MKIDHQKVPRVCHAGTQETILIILEEEMATRFPECCAERIPVDGKCPATVNEVTKESGMLAQHLT